MKTIAIDFDGVIHSYHKGWHDGTIYGHLVPGATEALRELQRTYAVYVHTSRNPTNVALWIADKTKLATVADGPVLRNTIKFWVDQETILVTDRKLPAVAYIDDRAIRFTYWERTLAEIGERVTP